MAGIAIQYDNYPGKFSVPSKTDPHAGYLPKGPPIPIPTDPNVLRFTANGKLIRNGAVINNSDVQVFRFHSTGDKHLEMYDDADKLVARYEHGKVDYRGGGEIKGKKFVRVGAPGKTGVAVTYEGMEYEIIQELFYAIVRTIPECERVAVVYNYTGKLSIEMIDSGIGNTELQTQLVFVTALMESKIMKKDSLGKKIDFKITQMPRSKANHCFEGENAGELLDLIATKRAERQSKPRDVRNRIIVRAPLTPRMVRMNEVREFEGEDGEIVKDETRPGRDVTMSLSNVFAHLKEAAAALKQMHSVIGQVHTDVCPDNLLLHFGKDNEIVYLLNDFDSAYYGRLNPTHYGKKAAAKEDPESFKCIFDAYTYEDMVEHLKNSPMINQDTTKEMVSTEA
ncbi:hypothetical protein ACEPAF_6198 [Sanghuangporus sanghuang]